MSVSPVGSPETAFVSVASSISANTPAGVQEGDLIVGVVAGTTSVQPAGQPSGWLLVEESAQWESRTLEMWWGWAPSSPPATYSFTMNGVGSHTLTLRAYRGADATNPINASAVDQHSDPPGGTSMVVPSVTTTHRSLLLAVVAGENVTWTVPGSMTERWDYVNPVVGGEMSQAGAEETFNTAGATGTRTFTASAGTGAGGILAAIRSKAWNVGFVGT